MVQGIPHLWSDYNVIVALIQQLVWQVKEPPSEIQKVMLNLSFSYIKRSNDKITKNKTNQKLTSVTYEDS